MDCLLTQLKSTQINNSTIITLSDILLIILFKWKETFIISEDDWNSSITQLITSLNEAKDNLSFLVMISIKSSIIQYLQIFKNNFDSSEWIECSCELINHSLRIVEKQTKQSEKSLQIEFKLAVASVSLLQSLVNQNSSRASVWIHVFRSHLIVESLANLLIYLIENKIGVELATHIMSLFVTLSSIKTSAETLFSIGFIDNLCVSLQNTYIDYNQNVIKDKLSPLKNWINVFHSSIRMIINLINELSYHFIEMAITYIAIHLDHMIEVLAKMRTCPKIAEIQESTLIVTLCHSISRYHQIWRNNHLLSFEKIQTEILKTSNSVIAFLIRPNLLSYIIENPQLSTAAIITSDLTPKRLSPTHNFEGKSLRKSVSWEADFANHSIDTNVHNSLLTLQAFSIAFLQNVSPNILELMEKQGINGCDWNLITNASFSSPNIDPDLSLSFGALINCIQMCIKTINRVNILSIIY
jgi:hypothetical protein